MIDAPDRPKPRFPAEKEAVAREAIRQAVARERELANDHLCGLAGGASGGDILFHEVCRELNVESILYLALPRDDYVEASVRPAGPRWVERFYKLYEALPHRLLSNTGELTDGPSEQDEPSIWQRNNFWLLRSAFAQDASGGDHVTLIALWDGEGGDGPGGTKDMVERARAHGAKTIILNSKSLFGLA
jgi:hypothetical protein